MKRIPIYLALVVATCLVAFTSLMPKSYEIGDDVSVKFFGSTPEEGSFSNVSGRITFDPMDLSASSFEIEVDVNSIEMDSKIMAKHTLAQNWFDAENYPTMSFAGKEVEKTDDGFLLKGEISIKGVSKEMAVPFSFDEDSKRFKSTFELKRLDFDIGKSGGKVDEVFRVEVEVGVN